MSELSSPEDPDEVEVLSLVQEQIPRYRLRADTVTDFTGYRDTDFLNTGAKSRCAAVNEQTNLDLSPEQIGESLNYFGELSSALYVSVKRLVPTEDDDLCMNARSLQISISFELNVASTFYNFKRPYVSIHQKLFPK